VQLSETIISVRAVIVPTLMVFLPPRTVWYDKF